MTVSCLCFSDYFLIQQQMLLVPPLLPPLKIFSNSIISVTLVNNVSLNIWLEDKAYRHGITVGKSKKLFFPMMIYMLINHSKISKFKCCCRWCRHLYNIPNMKKTDVSELLFRLVWRMSYHIIGIIWNYYYFPFPS